jgi:sec-independent protein translocase protein TatA
MGSFAFVQNIGWQGFLIILVIVLILFGPRKLPEVAEALGKSIQKFKKAAREVDDEIKTGIEEQKKDNEDKK